MQTRRSFNFRCPLTCFSPLLCLFAILLLLGVGEVQAGHLVRIGVLAARPKPLVLAQWQPLVEALTRSLAPHRFQIEAMTLTELDQAVANRQLDFVLTNPGHYVLLARRNGLSAPLATLAFEQDGAQLSAFGGVIFVRSDNKIRDLSDLESQKIAITSQDSLGGYQMQLGELKRAGLPLPDIRQLHLTGMPHDKVVQAVMTGQAQAGFVRSGVLEAMAKEGKIDLAQVRVVNEQIFSHLPFKVSTQLYPEWPFVALQNTEEGLARHVAAALFTLDKNPEVIRALGIHGFVVPSDYTVVADLLRELRMPPFDFAAEITLRDVWVQYRWQITGLVFSLFLILLLSGRLLYFRAALIREAKRLRDSEQHYRTLANSGSALIWTSGVDGQCDYFNEPWLRFTGRTLAQELGNGWTEGVHPDDLEHCLEIYTCYFERREAFSMEYRLRHVSGEFHWILDIGNPRFDSDGNFIGFIGFCNDISERKAAELSLKAHQKQLEHIAHHDPLTGLPNRILLGDRLRQAMAQCRRYGRPLAVAYIDLDGFKLVNDRYGHNAGDYLLTVLAERMAASLRETDTIARLGGDEFVVVFTELADAQDSGWLVQRLLFAVAEPVLYHGETLQVSSSIGVVDYQHDDDRDADQLLRQADQAMYQAKLAGKNRFHVFDAEQDRSVRGHHENIARLQQALDQREFVLFYQPKVNMRTGQVVGAEALIRWQHPERGLLPPGVFMPELEAHPLGIQVGEWVIQTALAQISEWARQAPAFHVQISVNIAANHLQQDNFAERLKFFLGFYPDMRPGSLELEVLETSALDDMARVSALMKTCDELGVRFALDDFGTGYSSLSYLKRLPVQTLKIDQSFVRDMLVDPDDLAILKGVLGLAMAFRREVIAEGVETETHGEALLALGCELAQGYGIARPMPASGFLDWVSSWRLPDTWVQYARQSSALANDQPAGD